MPVGGDGGVYKQMNGEEELQNNSDKTTAVVNKRPTVAIILLLIAILVAASATFYFFSHKTNVIKDVNISPAPPIVEVPSQISTSSFFLIKDDGSLTRGDGSLLFTGVTKKFYQTNPDIYDFLVVYTTKPANEAKPNYQYNISVSNNIEGIGKQIVDGASFYGSGGKLKSMVWNNSVDNISVDIDKITLENLNTPENGAYILLLHELGHNWWVYIGCGKSEKCSLPVQNLSTLFHWDPLTSSPFEHTISEAGQWLDNHDGTFTNPGNCTSNYFPPFHPIDLYLMGFASVAETDAEYFTITTADSYNLQCNASTTIRGTKFSFSVNDIIKEYGLRIPDSTKSQKEFFVAFILVEDKEHPASELQLKRLTVVINNFPAIWTHFTNDRSIMKVGQF